MIRQMLAVVALVLVAAGCSGAAKPTPSVAPTTATPEPVTTSSSPTSTTSTPVAFDPPRIGSSTHDALLDVSPLPIRVVEDAVLRVDGSCVTAETGDTATLLVFNLPPGPPTGGERYVWVQGDGVHFEDIDPATPTLVLSSGARYQFRGIPFDAVDGELAEPMPASCAYDEQLILLGALDAPVGHGLTTRPVEGVEGVGGMGHDGTPTITIDGACTTVTFSGSDRELLVVWPAGTVSLLDDHTIHMSRWEALFTETVVRSGDNVTLHGSASDRTPDDPPPDCEYDGTYFAEVVRPLGASGRTS
ncbi:MAG: hypothetical protein WD184_05730 [Acidimicrobiia bacterium]